jgi:hypothetical protein
MSCLYIGVSPSAHAFLTVTSYLELALILGPNLKKTKGIGSMHTLTKPSKLVAQPMPSVEYI